MLQQFPVLRNLPLRVLSLQTEELKDGSMIDPNQQQATLGFSIGDQETLLINILPIFMFVKFNPLSEIMRCVAYRLDKSMTEMIKSNEIKNVEMIHQVNCIKYKLAKIIKKETIEDQVSWVPSLRYTFSVVDTVPPYKQREFCPHINILRTKLI